MNEWFSIFAVVGLAPVQQPLATSVNRALMTRSGKSEGRLINQGEPRRIPGRLFSNHFASDRDSELRSIFAASRESFPMFVRFKHARNADNFEKSVNEKCRQCCRPFILRRVRIGCQPTTPRLSSRARPSSKPLA